MSNATITVVGLAEVRKGFQKLAAEDDYKDAMKRIADFVVTRVKVKVPKVTGKAADSYVPRGISGGARITFGGTKAEWAPWLEYGGSTKIHLSPERRDELRRSKKGSGRAPAYRERVKGGRYLWPTVDEYSSRISAEVVKEIRLIAKRAGLEVD